MARKFLYFVAFLVVLVIAGAIALRFYSTPLARIAFVPSETFAPQPALAANAYRDPAMWISRPGQANDPARWVPQGFAGDEGETPPFAVFFVHPTSYLDRAHWNAPLDNAEAQGRARLFVQGLASAFGTASEIWAPRYRQATFGAFLTDSPEGHRASDLAFHDVDQAFSEFLARVPPDMPVVLAGHSQGAMHVLRLLQERVAGTPLQGRIAAAYPIGWAISREHDLPAYGLPECTAPGQAGCLSTWSSFAEPAEADDWLELYRKSPGLDGKLRGDSPIVCTNPLTGSAGGAAPASLNRGTLVPDATLTSGVLFAGSVPARCDPRGLLLIGPAPALGPYVLPGNNYHVYDIPLFWMNLRADVAKRVRTWASTH